MSTLMSIGRLAQMSGVKVQTIRFYSDRGLLPPADVTDAGYRRYSDDDRLRLDTIRALRGFGMDLDGIRAVLDGHASARDALRLRRDTLDVQVRQLSRQRAVLDAALAQEQDPLQTIRRLEALTKLDALEREHLLGAKLRRDLRAVGVDEGWLDQILQAAFADLPTSLDDGQWAALVELVSIVSDDDFASALAAQVRPLWQQPDDFDAVAFGKSQAPLVQEALALSARDVPATAPAACDLAGRYCRLWARAHRRRYRRALDEEVLAHVEAHDPRAARVWDLVADLRKRPRPVTSAGYAYLFAALRARVVQHAT